MTEGSLHFHILEDIARDLSGDVVFPTCLDAAILIRNTLRDPLVDMDKVVQAIGTEPLITSKLLRLANSVHYNPSGERINDIGIAVLRLGFEIVRTTSLAVAMDQMLKSRHLAAYDHISRQTWDNSVEVAAIARVLARHIGNLSPDEAMLAGLVHNIGIFYLLYRAAEYPLYRENEPAMIALLSGWHEGIGESLLDILGLPASITDAVRDQAGLRNNDKACSISDVLYFAKQLASIRLTWLGEAPANLEAAEIASRYNDLLSEEAEDIQELRQALSG